MDGFEATLNRIHRGEHVPAVPDIRVQRFRDSRCHAAHARMMVVRRVMEERHVAGIQVQGVDQGQRFVMQCIDVARKPTVRVTASRTK